MYLKLGLREKWCLYEVMDAAGCFLGYSASSIHCCLFYYRKHTSSWYCWNCCCFLRMMDRCQVGRLVL